MQQNYEVPMVMRTLSVFDAFNTRGPRLFMTEVMELCQIPKTSAFRILETLRSAGYVVKEENNQYRLTYKLLEIASIAQQRNILFRNVLPWMEQLHLEFREAVSLGVFEEKQIVYGQVLESPRRLWSVRGVGGQVCFHATALGKALSAWLSRETLATIIENIEFQKFTPNTITSVHTFRTELARIREVGYAIDQEEETLGVICVAAPVFDASSRAVGAISIAGPNSFMTENCVKQVGQRLLDCSRQISRGAQLPNQNQIAVAPEQ